MMNGTSSMTELSPFVATSLEGNETSFSFSHHTNALNESEAAAVLAHTPRSERFRETAKPPPHCYKKTALPESEKELFYRIMLELRVYVSRKLKISLPSGNQVTTVEEYKEQLPTPEKFLLRDAVYEYPHLMDDFVEENPAGFPEEELAIIRHWRNHFHRGTYIVERHLQKGTIFITQEKNEEEKVFLVQGLENPLVEVLPKHLLPIVIKTVLLPFKGKVIYDGLFKEAPAMLNSHISRSLKEAYMRAKQQDSIITHLLPDSEDESRRKKKRRRRDEEEDVNLKKAALEITARATELKRAAPKGIESAVCSVLCMTSQLVNKVLENPQDRQSLAKNVRNLTTALNRL